MNLNLGRLRSQLILEEGLRLLAYHDTVGKLTIGVGRNLDNNPFSPSELSAIGHDGRTQAITHDQAMLLLDNDINAVCAVLDHDLPWWRFLDEIRARVLVDLCFNMGIYKLLGFGHFLSDLRTNTYDKAADDLQNSLWYAQVKSRGVRLVVMIRTGKDWMA